MGGLNPIAKVVALQFNTVAVRVEIIERHRQPMVEADMRQNSRLRQALIIVKESLMGAELERRVVHTAMGDFARIVLDARRGKKCDTMVRRVICRPRAARKVEAHFAANDCFIPRDHLVDPSGFECHMV